MPPAGWRWLLGAMVVLVAGGAHAQTEGPGVKISDTLVLHPGIAVGAGYDDNLYYATGTRNDVVGGVFYLAVRPGLAIGTRSAQRGGNTPHALDFRFHAGLPLRFPLSLTKDISNRYSIGADVGLLLSIFPFGAWSLDLFDNFMRTSNVPYAATKDNFRAIDIDDNQAGLRLRWRPGGQRFETSLQYMFNVVYFESALLSTKTSLVNDFLLRLKWKFFPKTALYLNVGESIYMYPNVVLNLKTTPPSAYPLRAVLGMLGLITSKFEVNVNAGYGNSFTRDNQFSGGNISYSSVIGHAEFTWRPAALTAINLGYKHDFAQSLIGTYFDLDGAWAGINQAIWKFNVGLRFNYEHRGFHGDLRNDGLNIPNPAAPGAGVNRTDHLLTLHAQVDYPFKDWLFASVGYDLGKNFSDCTLTVGLLPCNYLRNDVWLRMSVAY